MSSKKFMPEDLKSTEMNTSNENDESEGRDPKINYASPNLLRAHLNGKGELIVPSAWRDDDDDGRPLVSVTPSASENR